MNYFSSKVPSAPHLLPRTSPCQPILLQRCSPLLCLPSSVYPVSAEMNSAQKSSMEPSDRAQSLGRGDCRKDSGAEIERMKAKEGITEVSN